jgi:hypothetical protein
MRERKVNRCEDVELYMIGGLTKADKQAFEAHLPTCSSCQHALAELAPVVGALPLAVELVEPPAGMKSRILAAVAAQAEKDNETKGNVKPGPATPLRSEEESFNLSDSTLNRPMPTADKQIPAESGRKLPNWLLPSVSAAAVLLLIASGILLLRVDSLQDKAEQLTARVDSLQQQIDSTGRPLTGVQTNHVIALSPTTKDIVAQGLATIVVDDKGMHLIVQAEQLPLLTDNEAFQVWMLKNGKPVNAGTFFSQDGTGALYFTFTPDEYDQIAITQEPDASGKEPRGSIVLAGSL